MVQIRCVEEERGLEALSVEWNAALQASRSNSIFLTWEWISVWWRLYGASHRLMVLEARDRGGRLLGIAPLMVGRGRRAVSRHFRYLMFIGQDQDVTPEYLDFFVEPGRESEVTSAFWDFLVTEKRGEWDLIHLEQVLKTSPNLAPTTLSFARHGVAMEQVSEAECPYAKLPSTWAEYLAGKSRHFRKRVDYRARQVLDGGEVKLLSVPDDIQLEKAFDLLVRLNRERWGDLGKSFRTEAYCRFHRELCAELQRRGWLVMTFLQVAGRIVAAEYAFAYGGKIWGNQGGWSRDWSEKSVASVLTDRVLEWSIARGYSEYDFLAGASTYKRKWATDARQVISFVGTSRRTVRSAICGGLREAKRLVRRDLPELLLDRHPEQAASAQAPEECRPAAEPVKRRGRAADLKGRRDLVSAAANTMRELHRILTREVDYHRVRPTHALAFLTYRCPSHCRTCEIWKWEERGIARKDRELDETQWRRFVDMLVELQVRNVELFGGEALVRGELVPSLVEYIAGKGMEADLVTNGLLLNQALARQLVSAGLHAIYFSVDGVDEVHDSVRGVKGCFSKVQSGIRQVLEARAGRSHPAVTCNCTISALNVDSFEEVIGFAERVGADSVHLEYLGQVAAENTAESQIDGIAARPFFTPGDSGPLLLDRDQALRLKAKISELKRSAHQRRVDVFTKNIDILSVDELVSGEFPNRKCYMTRYMVIADPYGNLMACPLFNNYHLGNFCERHLRELLNNATHRRFMEAQRQGRFKVCRNCVMGVQRNATLLDSLSKLYMGLTKTARDTGRAP